MTTKEEHIEHHDDLNYISSEIAKARYRYNKCLNPDEKKIETDIEMFKYIMKIYGA